MRIAGKGLIDRSTPVGFRFDGRDYLGCEGDTLASALLANGVRLMARSFKYHRPRGVMTAGSEEPNALVTMGDGPRQVPNVRATVQEIFSGLEARSQNRWPSLGFDILGVNDLFAPFLGAGFYYKTFMWPRAFWERVYEPIIRRAAGIGALSGASNDESYEKAYAFCDLLVIGGGPAGLMAALVAGRAGTDVILADEDARLGGRLLAEVEEVGGKAGPDWVADALAELAALPNVRLMTRTTVTGAYDGGTYGALERVGLHRSDGGPDLPRECFWRIVAQRAVLASGALERGIAFADNDRPGVMMAGAVRAYLNRWGVACGKRVAVFCNNDDAHRTARDLAAAGVEVAALIDVRADARPKGDFPIYPGARVTGTRGRKGLREITVTDASGGTQRIAVDCLAVSGGFNPVLHLTCHLGGRPHWDEGLAAFLPVPDMVPGLEACGAANGVFSTAGALQDGARAAASALKALGIKPSPPALPAAEDAAYSLQPFWEVPGRRRAWIDFANDVTVKDVRMAAQENFASVEQMKRYTTQGMAPDQGKGSNVTALAVLADATARTIAETGTTTFRPPYSPISIAALGAGGQGMGFAPRRLMASDRASRERGAPMIEAGLWYRPAYFPRPGEANWLEPTARETRAVREAVGVADVSTLGKIDIQGPDAGAFLDFVYTNMFSTLAVGRVRYGLMLREDGHVLDDGTSARLAAEHYLMTTTTAAAGLVMRHLEFVHQAHLPKLDLRMVSVTEHWAQFAVAGPQARDLLNGILETLIDDPSFPFMACGTVALMGVAARLFRISFSGEQAYEIAVPARYGDALFRSLVARAEAMGGGAYGMEALDVLRVEKGFITHAEIHGRVTAFDLGLQGMMSAKKDFVGKGASLRPGLTGAGREQMVGLRPVEAGDVLSAGAHLFTQGEAISAEASQGYVTSVAPSPSLGGWIGLGFLRDGRARRGEVVRFVDHLRGRDFAVEVTDPVFLDKDGGRARG